MTIQKDKNAEHSDFDPICLFFLNWPCERRHQQIPVMSEYQKLAK